MKTETTGWILLASIAFAVSACGGKDEKEESTGASGSLAEISGALESPTGTLAADTGGEVGREFEEMLSTGLGGSERADRPVLAQSEQTIGCTVSGDISVNADSSGTSAVFAYNDCCQSAECCINGDGNYFYDTSAGAAYSTCVDFDIDYACSGQNTSMDVQYCLGADGVQTYVVEISSGTFAVSGSMSGGNGTLTVTDSNGTYTCTYTAYAGSCTDGTSTFDFGA